MKRSIYRELQIKQEINKLEYKIWMREKELDNIKAKNISSDRITIVSSLIKDDKGKIKLLSAELKEQIIANKK